MRIVIHQPYFLPWLGYFSKFASADGFFVLDDVQFRKRHYYDRTKIINMNSEVRWVGIPVGENFGQQCRNVLVPDTNFTGKIINTLLHSYARADHFKSEFTPISEILTSSIIIDKPLVDVDIDIIYKCCKHIEVNLPKFFYSSEFDLPNNPTDRIIEICNALGANELITGSGSSSQVHDISKIKKAGIRVLVQKYSDKHPKYKQVRRQLLPFQPVYQL